MTFWTHHSWQYSKVSIPPTAGWLKRDSIHSTTVEARGSTISIAQLACNAQAHEVEWDFELSVIRSLTSKLRWERNASRRPQECNRWEREQSWASPKSRCVRAKIKTKSLVSPHWQLPTEFLRLIKSRLVVRERRKWSDGRREHA